MLIDDVTVSTNEREKDRKNVKIERCYLKYWTLLVLSHLFVKLDFKEVSNNSSGN